MAYPKYIRLADHLTRGMRADINSGFSIAGYDVKEAPDQEDYPEQAAFVKRELSAGRLEQASKAEYDEVHPDIYAELGIEVERKIVVEGTVQEAHVQAAAMKAHRAVKAGRQVESEDEVAADEERRAALIEEAQEATKGSKKGRKGSKGADESSEGSEGSQGGSGS